MSNSLFICNINVNSYGVHRQLNIKFEDKQFILVYGANESGKSTLYSYTKTLISGFQSQKSKENHYLPVYGGEHGGQIIFKYGFDLIEVERLKKNKNIEYRSNVDDNLINALDSEFIETYRSIYAFDLEDLQSLILLEDQELREKVFTSGITGADNIFSDLLNELEDSSSKVFKPRSKALLQEKYESKLILEAELIEIERQNNLVKEYTENLIGLNNELKIISDKKVVLENNIDVIKKDLANTKLYSELELLRYKISSLSTLNLPILDDVRLEVKLYEDIDEFSGALELLNQSKLELLPYKSALDEINEIKSIYDNSIKDKAEFKINNFKRLVLEFLILFVIACTAYAFLEIVPFAVTTLLLVIKAGFTYKNFHNQPMQSDAIQQIEEYFSQDYKNINFQILDNKKDQISKKVVELEIVNNRITETRNNLEISKEKLSQLYKKYDVNDHQEFSRLINQMNELNDLKTEERKFLQIATQQGFDLTKQKTDEHLVEQELKYKQDLERILSDEKILINKKNKLELFIDQQIRSDDYDECYLKINQLEIEINNLYEEWLVNQISIDLIKKTQLMLYNSKYEDVIRIASEFLSKMSAGNFIKIEILGPELEIKAINRQHQSIELKYLSRGTLEQLYLALRLALISVYSKDRVKMPVLLDDILVNFDSTRAQSTFDVLKDFSNNHQIIMFTCHEWIKDLFVSKMSEHGQIISLS